MAFNFDNTNHLQKHKIGGQKTKTGTYAYVCIRCGDMWRTKEPQNDFPIDCPGRYRGQDRTPDFNDGDKAAAALPSAVRFDREPQSSGVPERDKATLALRDAASGALHRLATWTQESGSPIEIRDELEKVKHILSTIDDLTAMKSLRKE